MLMLERFTATFTFESSITRINKHTEDTQWTI